MNLQDWINKGKPLNSLINCDNMDLMAELPDNYFDLAICDFYVDIVVIVKYA